MSEKKYIGLEKTINQIETMNLWGDTIINFYNFGKTLFIILIPFWLVFPFMNNDGYSIIFEIIGILIIGMLGIPLYHSFPIIRKDNIILDLKSVISLRQTLISSNKNIARLIREDTKMEGIKPELIMNIKQAIQSNSENIKQYSLGIKNIETQRKYLFYFRHPFQYFSLISSLIKNEKTELISLIKDFTTSIQSWTALHQKELLEVEQELEKQVSETENLSGQGVIVLQRVRLHEHIENLNKISSTL